MESHSRSHRDEDVIKAHSSGGFVTVDEQGRLALPESVARYFGLAPGEQVRFEAGEHGIRLPRSQSSPAKIYVEPTTRCNMDCEMCQRRTSYDGPRDMAPAIFKRILEAIHTCHPRPNVVLGGFGEPLMHGHLMGFIEQCKNLGAGVELITDGLLLDPDRAKTLRDLELDRLWLSIDGASDRSRGHTMFREGLEELVHTIWRLNTVRHFPSINRLKVGIVFVAMKSNAHELSEVLELARQLPADRILISNLLPYNSEMSEEILYARSAWRMDRGSLQVRMARMDPSQEAAELLKEAMKFQGAISTISREDQEPFNTCPFVKAGSISIRWDGGVSPCLPLLHTHVNLMGGLERNIRQCLFGSLQDQGLLDIWELPVFVEFRKRVTRFDFPPCVSCGGCELTEDNETDCFGSPFPACGGCLWAQGLILCP